MQDPRALKVPEIDIYRSAKLLIDQHGEDAPIIAAMQADKCLAAENLDGKAVWMGVIRAIKTLLDRQPPSDGQAVHWRPRLARGFLFVFLTCGFLLTCGLFAT